MTPVSRWTDGGPLEGHEPVANASVLRLLTIQAWSTLSPKSTRSECMAAKKATKGKAPKGGKSYVGGKGAMKPPMKGGKMKGC